MALAGAGIFGLILLATAARLQPDPRGYGTHEQLGLTPCYFRHLTDQPCPWCGATTAWAHALRGEVGLAVRANAVGTLACGIALVAVPWILLSAAVGRWLIGRPQLRVLLILSSGIVVIAAIDWLRRWQWN